MNKTITFILISMVLAFTYKAQESITENEIPTQNEELRKADGDF